MKDNRLKEQVLKEIREALINKNPIDNRELTVTVGETKAAPLSDCIAD